MIDRYPVPVRPRRFVLDMASVESVLGIQMQSARIKKILESLGFSVRKGKGLNMEIISPTRRIDVALPGDLIEEIGRIGGYENIAAELPITTIQPPVKNFSWQWKNAIKDALVAAGYSEVRNYSFVCGKDCEIFGFSGSDALEIRNPVNIDLRFMRPSLLVNLLKNVKRNVSVPVLRQFEIGKIFGASLRMEPTMIAGIYANGNFFEMKGALEFACRRLGVNDFRMVPLKTGVDSLFNASQSARIFANGKEIGICGKINPDITDALDIEPLFAFELSMDVLSLLATEKVTYRQLPAHPKAVRDIAVMVPDNEYAESVINVIKKSGGLLVDSVELIDIYEGKEIPAGLKSLALRINYRSSDRTLTGKEIENVFGAAANALMAQGWQVRHAETLKI